MVLDMVAAVMSLGKATHPLAAGLAARDGVGERGLSQMFFALDPAALGREGDVADAIVASLHGCRPAEAGKPRAIPVSRR